MPFIRKFRTTSGATGVQVIYKDGSQVVKTVHIGSAETEKGIMKLVKKAQAVIDADKNPLFRLSDFDADLRGNSEDVSREKSGSVSETQSSRSDDEVL